MSFHGRPSAIAPDSVHLVARYYVDSVPGGLAIFDYNGDGRPDVFFTNGALATSLEERPGADSNRLYRNDGQLRFTDVTDDARSRDQHRQVLQQRDGLESQMRRPVRLWMPQRDPDLPPASTRSRACAIGGRNV
jgi:hypothetical protein